MVYFISGHRDLTWQEFAKWYTPAIIKAITTDEYAKFVVAECEGADRMAQDYLLACKVHPADITVYHMFESPRYMANSCMFKSGGYVSDQQRDEAMTKVSDIDIAFIRNGREKSGTAQNILRRWTKNLDKQS